MNTKSHSEFEKAGARKVPRVRLVIPAYRESARLPEFGLALVERMAEFGGAVELQVVDDGSGAEESGRMAALIEAWRERRAWVRPLLALGKNRGKGAAVYAGWDAAAGVGGKPEWLGFCDADGSVDADEVARFIQLLDTLPAEVGVLAASRRTGDAKPLERSAVRAAAARLFSIWVRIWTGLKVRDTQCGCKFVRMEHYNRIRAGLELSRFAFDVDLLAAVAGRGGLIAEEAVRWRHAKGGSLRVWRDGPAMLLAVARLRFRRGRAE
jgi:glycosyltransferase involved in cell wall biosynthesis